MKFIDRLREGKFWDKTSKYYQRAIQYNKGVAQDAFNFNLVTIDTNVFQELHVVNLCTTSQTVYKYEAPVCCHQNTSFAGIYQGFDPINQRTAPRAY